jgi:PAS domain S-box-containing protein
MKYSVIDHDGANHNFIFNKATYAAADGSVAGLIGVMLDITERNLAERTIRRDYDIQSAINEILQVSLENVPLEDILTKALELILSIKWISFESRGSIFLIDDDSNKLVMRAQKGLSSFIQKKCAIVELGRCICGRAAANQEIQFADGIDDCHEGHFEGMADHGHYCTPILFSGKTLGVITIYLETGHRRDDIEELFLRSMANALAGIIQRKRMESEREEMIYNLQVSMAKVSESKEMWQDTFDSIGDLIYVEDQNSSIIKANSAFAAHFGLAPREVIGKQSHEFFDTAGSQVPKGPNIQATKEYSAGTFEIQDKVTGKVFLVTAFPFHFDDAGQKGTIYIAKDITIERAKEMRLIMSERLASLGQMASGIAHEINNPLAAIAGCTEGLANRVDKDRYDSGLFRNYLAIISEEILRCKRITNSMLSFVRKTSYEKTEININDVLSRTIEIIGFQGRLRDVEVVRKFQDVLPVIYGSEGEMKQVFLSVITNALDAMDDKGQITITTEAGTNYVIIKISDNGSGMSAETIKMVFDPFFTTKSAKGGTGLGLSIAREIVISYNGSVDVISEEGKGTTLIISLPF